MNIEEKKQAQETTRYRYQPLRAYVVKTSATNPRHHGLRETRSEHVLTFNPTPGDQIVAVLVGRASWYYPEDKSKPSDVSATLSLSSESATSSLDQVFVKITSNPGRSASLGEDGLEDAFGNDVLYKLVQEHLDGADWTYSSIDCDLIPEPESDLEFDEWNKAVCSELRLTKTGGIWSHETHKPA